MAAQNCEDCLYYDYANDETDEKICTLALDEDEMERLASGRYRSCPYFRDFDEYKRVRLQN